jgi:3''-phosphoadenosine 5''-phosphosulfate sulfotransferase (PAPS reductase)/FAD synthetase and related enzymes
MTKIEKSIGLIQLLAEKTRAPAVMLSFGKDSMVLADLIRQALPSGLNGIHFPRLLGFPLPVIYHRDPWFPVKNEFADRTARAWTMEVHDFPPAITGVKTNDKRLELVSRYHFGNEGIDIPKNVCGPDEYARRDYMCGLNDYLMRPKTALMAYPWDGMFIGHKSSDVDEFEGRVPLKYDLIKAGGILVAFPLRDWSDEDVWDHIEANHIPVQETRYSDRREVPDKWYNNDYLHACTACVDPRNKADEVFCPKLKRNVPNHGHEVLTIAQVPPYIEKG